MAFSYDDPFASLRNRRWLITGGASGIGEAVVQAAFQLMGDGGNIHIVDRDAEGLARVCDACDNQRVQKHELDVTDPAACAELIEGIEKVGPIDFFVPSAGVVRPDKPGNLASIADLEFMLGVNLMGIYNFLEPLLPKMIARQSGGVAIVGSVVAHTALLGRSAYTISKHAVAGLTKSAAEIAGPYGVRINQIDPGRVMSPLVVGWLKDPKTTDPPTGFQKGCATQSTGTMPFPEQIARLIIASLSDQCEVLNGSMIDASSNWKNGHLPFSADEMPNDFFTFRSKVESRFGLNLTPDEATT